MYMIAEVSQYVAVASFTEAWIEILEHIGNIADDESPPSRRRGLKSLLIANLPKIIVASFTEAWIEIFTN